MLLSGLNRDTKNWDQKILPVPMFSDELEVEKKRVPCQSKARLIFTPATETTFVSKVLKSIATCKRAPGVDVFTLAINYFHAR